MVETILAFFIKGWAGHVSAVVLFGDNSGCGTLLLLSGLYYAICCNYL